jgi:hypothetical protein
MPKTERMTVTMPAGLVRDIDRLEPNRSRFVTEAVERELARRRHERLLESLGNPHPESLELAETGLDAWAASLPEGDEDLVDPTAGTAVRWVEGRGWVEEETR